MGPSMLLRDALPVGNCHVRRAPIMAEDLTNLTFGKFTVIERATTENHRTRWKCRCDCGNECIVTGSGLKIGNPKSCGCLRKIGIFKHGMSGGKSPLYSVWGSMIGRCRDPKRHNFSRYGGRGISVCDEWRNDFAAFRDWAFSHGYRHGLELDRINNDEGYGPHNCRFVTRSENQLNKRNTIRVTLFGKTFMLREAVDRFAVVSLGTVTSRLKSGWADEPAILLPRLPKCRRVKKFHKDNYVSPSAAGGEI